jgi:hypothetical protein
MTGMRGLDHIHVESSTGLFDDDNITVVHDNIHDSEGETFAAYSGRYFSLGANRDYILRVRAINEKGISPPSNVLKFHTDKFASIAAPPESFVIGQYMSDNMVSVSWSQPVQDGGVHISSYTLEIDTTPDFDPLSANYSKTTYHEHHEVQEIVQYFRSSDSVSSQGGTFVISLGGASTAALDHDVSDYDMEIALNLLFGTRSNADTPVVVTRSDYNYGYKWKVEFEGVHGDIGLLDVDDSMLIGDDPRMWVNEIEKGMKDIYPGALTEEIQSVQTSCTSNVSGTFKLQFEGYQTVGINYDASAADFKNALEGVSTIHTLDVTRSTLHNTKGLYSWTVTFMHLKHEAIQGAGNAPPLIPKYINTLYPRNLAEVHVKEIVKGSSARTLDLTGLNAGWTYHARLSSYNHRGVSLHSQIQNFTTIGPPIPVVSVSQSVDSATSLGIDWTYMSSVDYSIDKFLIECFASDPVLEAQTITTTSKGSLTEMQRITVDADIENIAGFWYMEFNGEQTGKVRWNANGDGTDSVAEALARLSTIGSVKVIRSASRRVVKHRDGYN